MNVMVVNIYDLSSQLGAENDLTVWTLSVLPVQLFYGHSLDSDLKFFINAQKHEQAFGGLISNRPVDQHEKMDTRTEEEITG
jgi:hypothetical protein